MPIYEYRCESCQETHEALQKLSDALLTECPNCGEQALKKQLTAGAFRLSGSGWYETDFKTGDKKKNLAGGASSQSDSKKSSSNESSSRPVDSGSTKKAASSESGKKTGASNS